MSKIIVLGAGLSGLASASLLARAGHKVTVLDKQSWLGLWLIQVETPL